MKSFVYKGPEAETTAYGYTFQKGIPQEVEGDLVERKLAGNPCFDAAEKPAKGADKSQKPAKGAE